MAKNIILVIGGTGAIGAHTVAALTCDPDNEIYVVGNGPDSKSYQAMRRGINILTPDLNAPRDAHGRVPEKADVISPKKYTLVPNIDAVKHIKFDQVIIAISSASTTRDVVMDEIAPFIDKHTNVALFQNGLNCVLKEYYPDPDNSGQQRIIPQVDPLNIKDIFDKHGNLIGVALSEIVNISDTPTANDQPLQVHVNRGNESIIKIGDTKRPARYDTRLPRGRQHTILEGDEYIEAPEKLRKFASLFKASENSGYGINVIPTERIDAAMLEKLTINMINPICAVFQKKIGEAYNDKDLQTMLNQAIGEINNIAYTCFNVNSIPTPEVVRQRFKGASSSHDPSTLKHLMDGKPVEMDILGIAIEVAKENQVATPILTELYNSLRRMKGNVDVQHMITKERDAIRQKLIGVSKALLAGSNNISEQDASSSKTVSTVSTASTPIPIPGVKPNTERKKSPTSNTLGSPPSPISESSSSESSTHSQSEHFSPPHSPNIVGSPGKSNSIAHAFTSTIVDFRDVDAPGNPVKKWLIIQVNAKALEFAKKLESIKSFPRIFCKNLGISSKNWISENKIESLGSDVYIPYDDIIAATGKTADDINGALEKMDVRVPQTPSPPQATNTRRHNSIETLDLNGLPPTYLPRVTSSTHTQSSEDTPLFVKEIISEGPRKFNSYSSEEKQHESTNRAQSIIQAGAKSQSPITSSRSNPVFSNNNSSNSSGPEKQPTLTRARTI